MNVLLPWVLRGLLYVVNLVNSNFKFYHHNGYVACCEYLNYPFFQAMKFPILANCTFQVVSDIVS